MRKSLPILAALTLAATPPAQEGAGAPSLDAAVTRILAGVRAEHDLPAMAAAIVSGAGVIAVGVAGVRKRGEPVPATRDDCWHLGSNTKAMTATVVARLVEEGRLGWRRPLERVFETAAPGAGNIDLLHLLTHRGGLPANLDLDEYDGDSGPAERRRALAWTLGCLPDHPPEGHLYSNLGYILVGTAIEKVTGRSWEEAMRTLLFAPLGMEGVGFGGSGTPGQLDQPWPHRADGTPLAVNGPAADNPPVMGPAGRIHCPLAAWAAYIADLLRGARGESALLRPETYRRLLTPPHGDRWAAGWMTVERKWGGGTVYTHTGSNTMNHATAWVAPKRNRAFLVCTNQGGERAQQAADRVVGRLLELAGLERGEEDREKASFGAGLAEIFLWGGCVVAVGLFGVLLLRRRGG